MIEIGPLKEATQAAVDELVALGRELHADERVMTLAQLEALVQDETSILMTVKDDGRIIAMAALYVIPKIGKQNGLLEDVVVDSGYRGQGLGERLVQATIDAGKSRGISSIMLTSNPQRVAAHKLYQKLGFVMKETDVFKLSL